MLEEERFTEILAFCGLGASQPSSDSNVPTAKAKAGGEAIARSRVVPSEAQQLASEIEEEKSWTAYLHGWRLQVVNVGLCLALFLSVLESTIISTSLVAITDALDGFHKSSWVVTVYLLTYTGFLIILAKLSDIYGRKLLMSLTLVVFIVFSIGCGEARSMTTLVILRAFQGIGGGGIYAMAFVILPEMVPTSRYALYATILSSTSAMANLLGPLLGGLINNYGSWKWVFLLNAPAGAVSLMLIILALPSNFPHPPRDHCQVKDTFTTRNLRRVDFLGTFLLLAASILFVAALQVGGIEFSWKSPITLSLLIVSIGLWPCFILWERSQDTRKTEQEPVFPWRLATDRFAMGALLNAFFVGATFITLIIFLPQKFQIVVGDSPLKAGYRLLALTLSTSAGAAIAGVLMQRLRIAPFYIFLGAGALQTIGLALMSTLSLSHQHIPATIYGYQIILGVGFGISLATVIMTIPMVVEKRDMAVAMSATGQFRMLGGSVAIAICTNALNHSVKSKLRTVLSPNQLANLLDSVSTMQYLPPSSQQAVRDVYIQGYDTQMKILTAFSGGAILATLMMGERKPRKQL